MAGTITYDIENFGQNEKVQLTEEQRKIVEEFKEEFLQPELQRRSEYRTIQLLQTAISEFDYIQEVANELKKSVYELTDLEIAQHHLEKREKFVKGLELENNVLFSNKAALESFRKFRDNLLSFWTKSNPAPQWLIESLKSKEDEFVKRVENEVIQELVVDSDVYEQVKNRNFPTFLDKGITASELIDFNGGYSHSLLPSANPRAKPFVELLAELKNPKISENEKNEKFKQLCELLNSNDHYDPIVALSNKYHSNPSEFTAQEKLSLDEGFFARQKQKWAVNRLSKKLGRYIKPGDLHPENRLIAGALDVHHPLLQDERVHYFHGEASEVDILSDDKYPLIKFTPKDDFNPPSHLRLSNREALSENPELLKELQVNALDFSYFEGSDVANPINAAEKIVELKLWKLFKYLIPELDSDPEKRRHFIENYDLSPGEFTLEWCLSFPPKEHTFLEYPMWVQVYEIDEVDPPVMWPYYYVRNIKTKVAQEIQNADDPHLNFKLLGDLAATKAIAKEVATAWKTLNREERIELLQYISPYYSEKTITDEDLEDVTEATQNFLDKKSNEMMYQERLKLISEELSRREEQEDKDMVDSFYTNEHQEPTVGQ